jgi:hypothetical protein
VIVAGNQVRGHDFLLIRRHAAKSIALLGREPKRLGKEAISNAGIGN